MLVTYDTLLTVLIIIKIITHAQVHNFSII